jgi:N-acetylneuraminic acid mutarotase
MTDLRDRFQALDDVRAPDLWREIQGRAAAVPQRAARGVPWALLAALLVALAAGGAALVGSGVLKPRPPVQPLSTWVRTGTLNEARYGQAATLLRDGRVLVMGGMGEQPGGWETASAELYDPATGSWTPTGSMTQARLPGLTATMLLDGRVLVTGWGPTADLYDPGTGTWTATGPMVEPRGDHTATRLLDGRVLVAGGGGEGVASAELYDPGTETWTATSSMATARTRHTAMLLPDGKVLVAGGETVHLGVSKGSASAELYDPATETWSATGSMSTASPTLGRLTATRLPNDMVLVIGQRDELEMWADLYDPGKGTWVGVPNPIWTGTDPAYPGTGHTATLLPDGRVLVVWDDGTAAYFDPSRATWTQAPGMLDVEAGPRHTATLLADGRLLVVGGDGSNDPERRIKYPAELFRPGPATPLPSLNESPTAAVGSWQPLSYMSTGRVAFTMSVLPGGRVLVTGGDPVAGGSLGVGASWLNGAELFDPDLAAGFEWSAAASMHAARTGQTATLLPNGLVLVAGGSGPAPLASAELYDPATDRWSIAASMHEAREGHQAILLPSGLVLVVGGSGSGDVSALLTSAELYDSASNTWTVTGSMHDARTAFTATLLADGRVLVVGGVGITAGSADPVDLSSAELYDPRSQSWSAAAVPPAPLNGHTATLLPGGSVLVTGGWSVGSIGSAARALLYDPDRNTWTSASPMHAARGGHSAALLDDGSVLVAGGFAGGPSSVACATDQVLALAELYDPATGTWTAAGEMRVARYHQVATLMPDGSVLIAGGTPHICQTDALPSVERYIPPGIR